MFITTVESKEKVCAIKAGDPLWMIDAGFVRYPRAMLSLSKDCPSHIAQQIAWAVDNGYLKAVAHVTEREMIFAGLVK